MNCVSTYDDIFKDAQVLWMSCTEAGSLAWHNSVAENLFTHQHLSYGLLANLPHGGSRRRDIASGNASGNPSSAPTVWDAFCATEEAQVNFLSPDNIGGLGENKGNTKNNCNCKSEFGLNKNFLT